MGITGSLGFLLTQGRTDTELAASIRLHIPGMSRATVQTFGVLQGLFGSSRTAPLRGGFGLSVHFAWDNGTSISGGYMHGRGEGAAPSAIYLGGPDYHIGRETSEQSYSRPPIPNRESVPSPWPWLIDKLRQEWNEAELANEAHRRGEDWLNDECFLYEEGKYDRPLRHLGKRDATGKFCNVGGKFVPMDEPLREVGGDLVPVRSPVGAGTPETPSAPQLLPPPAPPVPSPAQPSSPAQHPPDQRTFPPPTGEGQGGGLPRRGMGGEAKSKSSPIRKEVPKEETQVSSLKDPVVPRCAAPTPPAKDSKPSFGESATQFAKGFAHGVSEESRQIYNDTKELPSQLAKAGTELAEDLKSGRELRALAPLRAASHAIRNASRKDAERIAHAPSSSPPRNGSKNPRTKKANPLVARPPRLHPKSRSMSSPKASAQSPHCARSEKSPRRRTMRGMRKRWWSRRRMRWTEQMMQHCISDLPHQRGSQSAISTR